MLEFQKITKKTITIGLFLISSIFFVFFVFLIMNFISSFQKIKIEEFNQDPDAYIGQLIENLEQIEMAKITSSVNFNSSNESGQMEAIQFFDKKSRKQIVFFTINTQITDNILDTKGVFFREKSKSYLILNRIKSSDTLLRSIKIDQWYEIDMQPKTPSNWMNFLVSKMHPRELRNILKSISRAELIELKNKKTDHPEKLFIDFEISPERLNKSKNKIASLLKIYYHTSREIAKELNFEGKNNSGQMTIDKKDLSLESIALDIESSYSGKPATIKLNLNIEKDIEFPSEIKATEEISLSDFVKNSTEWKSRSWIKKLFNF